MLISKPKATIGICFACLPIWTNEGRVWFEIVHFRLNDSGGYSYERVYYRSDPTWHDKIVDYSKCSFYHKSRNWKRISSLAEVAADD